MIGHETFGSGEIKVVLLNDWLCDTSTWEAARAYLDQGRFTWAFTDLRGYGRSKGLTGRFDLEEAAADVIALADALGWGRFAIVGHSMSTLIALHLAQRWPERITRAVVLTPPPPSGFGADEATLAAMQGVALGDDTKRTNIVKRMWGDRLSEGWVNFKVARWRAAANPEAVAAYVRMFARDGMPDPKTQIRVPVLAVTGEHDAEHMRQATVTELLSPLCEQLTVTPIADSGHYPMQETPPLLATIVERFLAG